MGLKKSIDWVYHPPRIPVTTEECYIFIRDTYKPSFASGIIRSIAMMLIH